MSNKKVYLAKNTLASGFDVEYVRSHLSRIPGIIIVEAGGSIGPSDCAAFVIVPDPILSLDEIGDKVTLSKNVYTDLVEFLEDSEIADPEQNVFIASEHRNTDEPGDVEESFPMALYLDYDHELSLKKKEHYDKFASINIVEDDQTELLYGISEIIDAPHCAWVNVKRHHIPAPAYAMPPVPSIEERQSKVSAPTFEFKVVGGIDKRLLLLRRK